ncbi:hypothetical protein, partial [Bifidobacterium adolescentis]|uniref:hypothetical protein n=1 Tax=Bifidobacterium adolescentis TaxID=1680 RepID=UPI0034A55DC8
MNSMFNQLLNVKGTVVEGVRIADSPIASRTRARDPRASAQGHAQMLPMRWTRHTPTTAENLTHENSRSLKNNILVFSEILAHGGVCPCVFHSCNKARYCRTSS